MEAFNPNAMPFPFPYTYAITNMATNFSTPPPPYSTLPAISTAPNTLPIPTQTTPWMDNRIWSRLPTRILDRVLAFLPPPAFFRARSVCKRWYSLLFSPSFLHFHLHLSPPQHWFIFFPYTNPKPNTTTVVGSGPLMAQTQQQAFLFDPYELAWYAISFPGVPAGYSPGACSGGLVCWVLDQPGTKSLFLHNPLTGSTTHLPAAASARPRLLPSVGLSVTANAIHVALSGDDMVSPYAVKNLTAEGFHVDVARGTYGMSPLSALPRLCSLESGRMVRSGLVRFYCMNYSPFSVLAHDTASNAWWKIQAPMRRFLRNPSLVELGQGVVMVAAVEKSKLNVPRSLRMWALQEEESQWVEMERMPHQLYLQFAEVEQGRGFDCVGQGEFIVIMIRGVHKGLLFDFDNKRWVWLSPPPGHGGGGELRGFGYEPRLAAPVTALVEQLALAPPPLQ